jgi:hypothetical protein
MIIIYEVGDMVTLEDDIEVGELANHWVKLIRKAYTLKNTWIVESEDNGETATVHEKWFLPH